MQKVKNKSKIESFALGAILGIIILVFLGVAAFTIFERSYANRIYPNVSVGGVPFGGKTPREVKEYWLSQNEPFTSKIFEFRFGKEVATISAIDLNLGYDATLSATQAFLVGRSKHFFSDFYTKFIKKNTDLAPYFRWDTQTLEETLTRLAQRLDIPVQDALFSFSGGRVTAFRPSRPGRRMNVAQTQKRWQDILPNIPKVPEKTIVIEVSVETIEPSITTDQVNTFGIKELLGRGYSEFAGSIPGRIHNIVLAASRLNGLLIKPGEIFSFNDAVGDISAATGYQSAYIIKDGRTVLGDGGGVCQVSTTLFRAALAAGLPIVERRAHAYRVHYYEDDGSKPGLDATVFAPSVDLKFKNDTPSYILIQAKPDTKNLTLTFELYGTSDGRRAEILNHQVWGITPPPPPLYQDDPTLPPKVTRQVDFAAWGAKASFRYKVTRNGEALQDTTFYSNFQPWQAVYLRGPQ
ncbi:MAG: VanW family protein [Patescibacteria group bacterium]